MRGAPYFLVRGGTYDSEASSGFPRGETPESDALRTFFAAELKAEVTRVHAANVGVYGARKVWRASYSEKGSQ
jgi:hypothetical protein